MSKDLSERKRKPGEQSNRPKFVTDEDIVTGHTNWNKQQPERHRQGEAMGRKQDRDKFVSDEDIIRRRVA